MPRISKWPSPQFGRTCQNQLEAESFRRAKKLNFTLSGLRKKEPKVVIKLMVSPKSACKKSDLESLSVSKDASSK